MPKPTKPQSSNPPVPEPWNLKMNDRRGRPKSAETKLGRYLVENNYKSGSVAAAAGFTSRLLTEYMAGRRNIPQHHLLALCRVLEVTPDKILDEPIIDDEDDDNESQLHDAQHTVPGLQHVQKINDLKRQHQQRLQGG